MKYLKLLIILTFGLVSSLSAKDKSSYTGILDGESEICIDNEYTYIVYESSLPADRDDCPVFYDWDIVGHESITYSTGNPNTSASVTINWSSSATTKSVAVIATNRLQAATGDETCSTSYIGSFSTGGSINVTEGSCSDDGGGTTEPLEPFVGIPIFREYGDNGFEDSGSEPIKPKETGTFCSRQFAIGFLGSSGDTGLTFERKVEVSIGDNQNYIELVRINEELIYHIVDFDTLIDEVSQVFIRLSLHHPDYLEDVSDEFEYTIIPKVDLSLVSVNPPICEGETNGSIVFNQTNSNVSDFRATISPRVYANPDYCDSDSTMTVDSVLIGGTDYDSREICVIRKDNGEYDLQEVPESYSVTVKANDDGSFEFGPETKFWMSVNGADPDSALLNLGQGLYQIQIVAADEFGNDLDESCPVTYFFEIPEPSILQEPQLDGVGTTIDGSCFGDEITISGYIAYNLAYTNNPNVRFYLYEETDEGTVPVLDGNGNNISDLATINADDSTANFSFTVTEEGEYTVKAKKDGCTVSEDDYIGTNQIVTVRYPDQIQISNRQVQDEQCYQADDGRITFDISGGTGNYHIVENVSNSVNFVENADIANDLIETSSLTHGSYTLSFYVVDDNGCQSNTINESVTIEEATQINIPSGATTISNPTCIESNNGSITVAPAGGAGSYEIEEISSVTPSQSVAPIIDGLTINGIQSGRIVRFIVKDEKGCRRTFQRSTGNTAFNISTGKTLYPGDCYNDPGNVRIRLYNYANDLADISMKLFNSQGSNISDQVTFDLDETTGEVLVKDIDPGNGYYFEFTDGTCTLDSDLSEVANRLSFDMPNPVEFKLDNQRFDSNYNIDEDKLICKDTPTEVSFDIVGGTADFNLSLYDNADPDNPDLIINGLIIDHANRTITTKALQEGDYIISGTDVNNCPLDKTFSIGETDELLAISASAEVKYNAGEDYHISKYGEDDGEISFEALGGDGNYIVNLFSYVSSESVVDTITNSTSGTFSGLNAKDDSGNPIGYFLRVMDELGCTKYSDTLTLTEPDSLIFTYELNNYVSSGNDTFNIKCNGGRDEIRVDTEGGVYPHLVRLFNSNNQEQNKTLNSETDTAVFQDLPKETYRIEVIDKYFDGVDVGLRTNIFSDSIDFVQPDSLNVVTSMTQPICYGDSTGSITITPSGGVPFANGEYEIHIFDQNGNSILNEITDELSIVADSGIYYYTIFDAFNCEYESEEGYFTDLGNKITVTELQPRLSVVKDTVTYPPCAGDETATLSVSASGGRSDDGSYILELYDNNDPPLYGTSDPIYSVTSDSSGDFEFENLFAGDYTVTVYDDELCSEMIPIKIEERGDSLDYLSVEPILSKCANSSDAKLKIISIGGDSPHSFSLNNNDFSPSDSITYSDDSTITYYHKTFTGLKGDSTYNIYLKDDNYYDSSYNNVCLVDTSQFIPKTPSLALSFEKTDIQCFGEENGDFTLSPSYGDIDNINDFTIEINGPNGVVSHDQGYVDNLSPGRYDIKIKLADTTACQTPLFDKIEIDQPEPLIVDIFSSTAYNCSTNGETIFNGEVSGGLSTDILLYAINSENSADFDTLNASEGVFRISSPLEAGWNVFYLKSSPYNCIATDSFFVESEQPNLQILTNQAASCFGKSDGEISVTSNFEKLNFKLMNDEDTFSINDLEADTIVFEGLEAGIYQLTGSYSSCLADTLEVIVNQPDSIIIQPVLVEKPSCNQANGIGTVNISGGTEPYEILWQTENGNILDSTSLKSGYYDIIVEDANNCSAIFQDFLVEELNDFTVSVQSSSNPTCGKDNGSILIQPNEGIPPYDFSWFKDGSKILNDNDSLTGLAEGSYTFSVTDAMGCVFEDSVELIGSASINVNISEESPANCSTQNGSVTLSVTGGNPPYTYTWPDSIPYAEGNYAEGLWGGEIYTVSVSDANLCSMDYEFAIGNNGAPEIAVNTTNPKCGLANGSIEIEALSENNASYEWRGFETTSSTLENIPSGIYFVTVTANDCPITRRIELTEDINNPLSVNPIHSNANCNDIGGEIDLNILGGTPPYAISWDDTPLNDSIRTGLSSGNYSFVVTDSVGCTASGDIYLGKEELPQLSLNSIGNAACGETNGYIQLDSLSGDYTFNWSHNDLLDNHLAENLSSGLYSVYAVNATGCSTDTVSYYISSSNTDLKIQEVAVISASCNESTDGSLEVNAVNGVPPYQYEWDDEDQQTGNIAQGLRPGTYTVRVTDATNCSRVKSLTLGQVNPIYISNISKNAPSCTDAMDGSIAITASGGKGNYSYEWSTGDTTSTISGLGSGEYSVTVYDNFVCSDQASIIITAPDTLSAEYFSEKPNCYATADGQVNLSISGGIPPYTVEWEDGSTLSRRFDLTAGNYEVFISDNNNCSLIKNINVPSKDSVSIDYEITSVSCDGGNDGSIRIKSISNANSPKVEWSNGQIGNTLRNVSAGFYEVDVTDSYGCVTSFEFEVGSPDPLQVVNDTITDVLCKNGFNGSIVFDVIGGNGNYNFNWDDGSKTKNRFNLTAGNYKVMITDDLNCTIERQFSISEPDLLVVDYKASSVSCFGNADGFASIEIEGGVSPYQISWSDGASDSIRNDLAAGTHDVLVTDANNCSESIEVIIPNLNPITINEVIQTIPSCYQGSDGELELDISGGVAPYSVSWSNGKTGTSIDSISAGNYQVTITDDNNCQLTELISLGDATPIYLTSLVTANPICYGEPSGMVEVVPNGGNPPFEVVWADGTTANRRDDLLAGSHTFNVVDATGCSVSYEINLQDPPLEEIEGLPSEVFLCTGGVANLDAGEWNSYNWTADNGFTSNEREVLIDAEGNYNLTVTNQEGCEDNHQFTVTKDDNILTADFLLTTEAVVQDTVIIVDVSWRVPDSVRWINPDDPDFYLVSQTEEYQEVIFTRTGEFELNMKAKLDFCEADVSKTITVLSREEAARLSDEANKNISNDLHVSTSIYPNPNHGDFRIEMKGNKEYDHNSKIIDVNTGIEYYRFSGKKQMNYVLNIGDNRLPDGVYLLMLEAEGKTITKRFIVK